MSARTTRGQSTLRVARRRPAGDVDVHRRGPPTTTRTADCRLWRQRRPGQMGPRPGRGRARGAVPRSRFRRNPEGTEPSNHCRALIPVRNGSVHSARSAAWVLMGSAIVRLAKVARPRMRAIAALLLLDDPHRDRLRRRALRSPHFHSPIWKFARSGTLSVNTHARDRLYFHHGLLVALAFLLALRPSPGAAPQEKAELVVTHAKLLTLDKDFRIVETAAVRAG